MNYINLASGLEYLDILHDVKFIRVQSTLCEQKQWSRIIEDLDYDFLINLAQGEKIYVYDTSRNKKVSRALFQGLEFVRYAINRRWFGNTEVKAYVKSNDVTEYFAQEYAMLSERAKKKLDYIKKFLNTDEIYLYSLCCHSAHDGDYEYYRKFIKENMT